jgi:hypothetical protein
LGEKGIFFMLKMISNWDLWDGMGFNKRKMNGE